MFSLGNFINYNFDIFLVQLNPIFTYKTVFKKLRMCIIYTRVLCFIPYPISYMYSQMSLYIFTIPSLSYGLEFREHTANGPSSTNPPWGRLRKTHAPYNIFARVHLYIYIYWCIVFRPEVYKKKSRDEW